MNLARDPSRPLSPAVLRVLLLDDDATMHTVANQGAQKIAAEILIDHAETAVEAAQLIEQHFYDLIIVDLFDASGSMIGLEMLRYLSTVQLSSDVAIVTHVDLNLDTIKILDAIAASRKPRVSRFVDKRKADNFFRDSASGALAKLGVSRLEVDGLEDAAERILEKSRLYRDEHALRLRDAPDEIAAELERLLRKLFVDLPGGARSTKVSVSLRPLERLGLSAAVTLRAVVELKFGQVQLGDDAPADDETSSKYECLLKVGPRGELTEEASRYLEFVRYGVRLEERVELLGFGSADSLGGIVYSMAGGSRGEVQALDEVLGRRADLSVAVIEKLFGHTYWYDVDAGTQPVGRFFSDTYRFDYLSTHERVTSLLAKNCRAIDAELSASGDEVKLKFQRGARLRLPGRQFTGNGELLLERPWCLVHGDMHGGNVLVELEEHEEKLRRVSLIDYRQAGPGPRCIDAAALDCAIRLADAEKIRSVHTEEAEAAAVALSRSDAEFAVQKMQWIERDLTLSKLRIQAGRSDPWVSETMAVHDGVRRAFRNSVEPLEYLATAILLGVRQMGYPLPATSRLRLAAWVGASFRMFERLQGKQKTVK